MCTNRFPPVASDNDIQKYEKVEAWFLQYMEHKSTKFNFTAFLTVYNVFHTTTKFNFTAFITVYNVFHTTANTGIPAVYKKE